MSIDLAKIILTLHTASSAIYQACSHFQLSVPYAWAYILHVNASRIEKPYRFWRADSLSNLTFPPCATTPLGRIQTSIQEGKKRAQICNDALGEWTRNSEHVFLTAQFINTGYIVSNPVFGGGTIEGEVTAPNE